MDKIRVVVCDDLQHIREYFCELINARDDMEVVGTAENKKESIEAAERCLPDVILMDIQMDGERSGLEATKEILEKHPNIKIIVITIHEEDEYILEAYLLGVVDFVVKTRSREEICDAIVNAYNGNKNVRSYVADKLLSAVSQLDLRQKSLLFFVNTISKLTITEFEILQDLYMGKTQKQIAKERFVELVTIKFHVTNILRKFGSKSTKSVIKDLKEMKFFELFYMK